MGHPNHVIADFGRVSDVEQGVALTERHRTGLPCSVGRPTAHAPGRRRPTAHEPSGRPARRQRYRRRQTTDASEKNNSGPLGWPVRRIWMMLL